MKEARCRKCYYRGYLGGTFCCDYALITGHTRTAGMTKEQKKEPCKEFREGKRPRTVSRILLEAW